MKRKDALYELLIQHAGTYCSGETLAQELGISRAAVWKAVQTLRTESNVPIQSHPKKGYCIPADADLLTVAAVQPHLKTQYLALPFQGRHSGCKIFVGRGACSRRS